MKATENKVKNCINITFSLDVIPYFMPAFSC